MMGDKKKALTAILGPESDNIGVRGEDGGPSSDLHEIAHELIGAVHDKDAAGVVAAFKALVSGCEAEPHEEGE